ncbi:hypothetical protein JZ785_18330 [Alicyclobacillus curvatus]|nr:hypothetical protein JZ785_18330 [Alicyclobacillus curvatus]
MEHLTLSEELCEAIIDQLANDDNSDYAQANTRLVNEIYELVGEDEEKLARINDALVAFENSIVRPAYKVGYDDARANSQPISAAL